MSFFESDIEETGNISVLGIRQKLVDRLLFASLILALIAGPASILRYQTTGWLNLYSIHLTFTIVVLLVYLARNTIPFFIKNFYVNFMFFLVSLVGLYSFGIFSVGIWWLMMSCCLISILYSKKAAVVTFFIYTAIVCAFAFVYVNGLVSYSFDLTNYATSPVSWLVVYVAASVFPIIIFFTLNSFQYATIKVLNELKLDNTRLTTIETHDPLTGLLMNDVALDQLELSIISAKEFNQKVGIILFDLQGIKTLNEILGYSAGNSIIKEFSQRLTENLTENDIAARIGGNQFLVIMNNVIDTDAVEAITIQLLEILNKPFKCAGKTFMVRTKAGIGMYPDHADSSQSVIHLTEKAVKTIMDPGAADYAIADSLIKRTSNKGS